RDATTITRFATCCTSPWQNAPAACSSLRTNNCGAFWLVWLGWLGPTRIEPSGTHSLGEVLDRSSVMRAANVPQMNPPDRSGRRGAVCLSLPKAVSGRARPLRTGHETSGQRLVKLPDRLGALPRSRERPP